jgi:hypothetical protein
MRISKNEQELLAEAYEAMKKKQDHKCKCDSEKDEECECEKVEESMHKCECGCDQCGPKCPCDKECECKTHSIKEECFRTNYDGNLIAKIYANILEGKKSKKHKPDYLDVDGDGNKKEPMKKALKDQKVNNKK